MLLGRPTFNFLAKSLPVANCASTLPDIYGGPKVSRHKQELHGTNKNSHGTNENFTAQTKTLTAQTKTSRHKQKLSRHKRKLHGTNKNSHGTNENFTAQTKTLTAEVNLTAEMAVYFTRAVTQSLKIWRNR